MEENEFIEILKKTICQDIRHDDYDHVVEDAKFNKQIETGKGQDCLIIQFHQRESGTAKQRRVELTNTYTPYVHNQIKNEFKKPHRTTPKIDTVTFEEDVSDEDKKLFADRQKEFKGKQNLKDYIFDTSLQYYFGDTNAFMVFERDDFKNEDGQEDTKMYAYVANSEEAIDYKENNGNIEWLIVKMAEQSDEEIADATIQDQANRAMKQIKNDTGKKLETPKKKNTIDVYYMYRPGYVIRAMQVNKGAKGAVKLECDGVDKYFTIEEKDNGTNEVPAVKLGGVPDPCTDNRTMCSPMRPAEGIYKDIINEKSRLDITKNLHTFLQKYVYVERCHGKHEEYGNCHKGCYGGNPDHPCQTCAPQGGHGNLMHGNDLDVIKIYLPEWEQEDDKMPKPVPLSTFGYYLTMPHETPKFQAEELEKQITRVGVAVFNCDMFTKNNVGKTPTEIEDDCEKVYNVIHPYGKKISEIICLALRTLSSYLEIPAKPYHEYDFDYKMRSLLSLIAEFKAAKDAGLGSEVLNALKQRIIEKVYSADQTVVQDILAFGCFKPFTNLSEVQIMAVMQERYNTDRDLIIYQNFDRIVKEITQELRKDKTNFGAISDYEKQKEIFDAKVDEIAKSINFLTTEPITALPSE